MIIFVGKDDLLNVVGFNFMIFNFVRIIGFVIVSLVILIVGIEMCFLVNVISFVLVIIGVFMIDVKEF